MGFGPFKLMKAYIEGPALILDLADENGQVLHKPRRLMSFYGHAYIFEKAKSLVGKSVLTTTENSTKNPPAYWWIDVDEVLPHQLPRRTSEVSSNVTKEIDSVDLVHEATVLDEGKLANLLRKYE